MPTYGHFLPYGHFPIPYILYGHFIPYGQFPLWTLFHMDILPYGQFADSPESLLEVIRQLLSDVNKLLKTKKLLTTPSNALPLHLKQTFPPIV